MLMKFLRVIILTMLFHSVTAWCNPAYVPFNYADMNPLTLHYGSPRVTTAGDLSNRRGQLQWTTDVSNTVHIQGMTSDNESLILDAETQRHAMTFEFAMSEKWNLLLELPFIRHGPGFLDGFIRDFHSSLGFPSGPRSGRGTGEFLIAYNRKGLEPLVIGRGQSGIGDVSVSMMRKLESGWEDSLDIGFKLKFPSGRVSDLTGSGTYDIALWAAASKKLSHAFSHYLSLEATGVEKNGGLLPELRTDVYASATYGIGWRYSELIELKMQVDARTSIYGGSAMRALGHSIALSIGGTLHFANGYDLDIAVVEDIDVGTSPDVVFHFNLRNRF